ncbi:formylglycine-generating enzyme family protein [Aestuariispira ectoiniformans]|uniref:formylglycine-generating enzyme family protein n=1 Tax=Aestuariispira ectoiniformans TaxID=2775080 RepID=UPI00223BE2F9|nr:formylglycine-generating enzyme family protein [Aestuariispira ectoiniformans]
MWRKASLYIGGVAALTAIAITTASAVLDNKPGATDLLPNLEMVAVKSGSYNLTIAVAGAFGIDYMSRPAKIASDFEISRYEITIAQWNRCYQAGGCPHAAKTRSYQTDDQPVTNVNWLEAFQFTRWLSSVTGESYRLPTEEEWAYVAFSGTDVTREKLEKWSFERNITTTIGTSRMRKIGAFGQTPWGVSDVKGNVWEWTMTCWFNSDIENKHARSIKELEDPELCANRVVQGIERGHVPFFVGETYSGGCSTGRPIDNIGFRIVREL